jgi:hypothetical protein
LESKEKEEKRAGRPVSREQMLFGERMRLSCERNGRRIALPCLTHPCAGRAPPAGRAAALLALLPLPQTWTCCAVHRAQERGATPVGGAAAAFNQKFLGLLGCEAMRLRYEAASWFWFWRGEAAAPTRHLFGRESVCRKSVGRCVCGVLFLFPTTGVLRKHSITAIR